MLPLTPEQIDGVRLDSGQRLRLARLIQSLREIAPTRDPVALLDHARQAFLLTVDAPGTIYVDRSCVRLDRGHGPVLRLRQVLPD